MTDELIVTRMNEIEGILLALQREVKERISTPSESFPTQEYYTLREAVVLKYGKDFPYSTVSTNYALMPCGNSNYEIYAGKRMWSREKILEWIKISDSDIPAYLERYNVPLKGRFAEKYKKYIKKENSV